MSFFLVRCMVTIRGNAFSMAFTTQLLSHIFIFTASKFYDFSSLQLLLSYCVFLLGDACKFHAPYQYLFGASSWFAKLIAVSPTLKSNTDRHRSPRSYLPSTPGACNYSFTRPAQSLVSCTATCEPWMLLPHQLISHRPWDKILITLHVLCRNRTANYCCLR